MSDSSGDESHTGDEREAGGGGGGGGGKSSLSAHWLEGMLASYKNLTSVKVLDYVVGPGSETNEMVLSDIVAVCVTYVADSIEETKIDLIVKLLPQDPYQRYFVTEAQFDFREIKFYTKVVPELIEFQKKYLKDGESIIELPIPICYHAHYSSGDERIIESVLVLENLKTKGYQVSDFARGLTLEQSEQALQALAKMHGLTLAIKIKDGQPLDKRYPFLFQTARATDSYQQLVERGLPQLSNFLEGKPGTEGVMAALTRLKPDTKEQLASLLTPEEPMGLMTHTDFWCNNLLFSPSSKTCCILDWQMITYSRPTNDIALLILSSLPTQLRRNKTKYLLDVYWDELNKICQRLNINIAEELNYDRQNLEADYEKSRLLALLLCIGSVDVALGNSVTEQRLIDLLQDLYDEGVITSDAVIV